MIQFLDKDKQSIVLEGGKNIDFFKNTGNEPIYDKAFKRKKF